MQERVREYEQTSYIHSVMPPTFMASSAFDQKVRDKHAPVTSVMIAGQQCTLRQRGVLTLEGFAAM